MEEALDVERHRNIEIYPKILLTKDRIKMLGSVKNRRPLNSQK